MRSFKIFVIILLALSSLAAIGGEKEEGKRAAVLTRPQDESAAAKLFYERERGDDDNEPAPEAKISLGQTLSPTDHKEAEQMRFHWGYAPDLYAHPGVHSIYSTGGYGEVVEIEDGSLFSVRGWDQYTVRCWPPGSPIYIVPNHGYCFGLFKSGYDFCLVNAQTLESVEVNLALGPFLYGDYSHWIVAIDDLQGVVHLCDGASLLVDPADLDILWSWLINEHVILGSNDGRHHYGYPNILINVASVDYIRVRFIN